MIDFILPDIKIYSIMGIGFCKYVSELYNLLKRYKMLHLDTLHDLALFVVNDQQKKYFVTLANS